jgi:hypothetical protein
LHPSLLREKNYQSIAQSFAAAGFNWRLPDLRSSQTACSNCTLLPWGWIAEKAEEIALRIPFVQTL